MQIHVCLLIVTRAIIVLETIRLVWLVLLANTNHNKAKRHVMAHPLDIMSRGPDKLRKQHARPVPRNHNKAKGLVTTVKPENTSRNKVKRLVSTRLLDIMSLEIHKQRKRHARLVPRNHNKVRRPAIIVPPANIKTKPARIHVKTVAKDIVQKV
jgi:hypothetical protein